jgi:hypothetical protein
VAGRGVADILVPVRASVALIGRHKGAFLALLGTAAAAVTFLWPFVRYVDETTLAPGRLPPSMGFEVALTAADAGAAGDLGDLIPLQADIQATNYGTQRVVVLAAWYALERIDLVPVEGVSSSNVHFAAMNQCGPVSGTVYAGEDPAASALISTGRFLDGWTLDPNEPSRTQRILWVRPEFDVVRITVNALVARATALEETRQAWARWDDDALTADSSHGCDLDIGGTLSAGPAYVTTWRTRPRLPQAILPGWWDGLPGSWDRRYLTVEWRPFTAASRPASTTDVEAGRCPGSTRETCLVPYLEIGNVGTSAWIEPWLGVCEERLSGPGVSGSATDFLEDCRFLEELDFEDMVREWDHFALARTIARTELVMPRE